MKDELIEILKIQSESHKQIKMFEYIIEQLKRYGYDYHIYNGCIYVKKGITKYYPCVVAHMDTVHAVCEDLTVIEINGNLTGFNSVSMEQTGIGGDDKVGIFIALECLKTFDNIKAVFFRDEETGCEGSYDPDKDFFIDCGFVLQCDRQGHNDFITIAGSTKLSEKDFQNDITHILKDYKYTFKSGFMTDVMALKESGIECSMANISCGYYNPHMDNEYVNIRDVFTCLNMVKDIIYAIKDKSYICKYTIKKDKYFNQTKYYDSGLDYWDEKNWNNKDWNNGKELKIQKKNYCVNVVTKGQPLLM